MSVDAEKGSLTADSSLVRAKAAVDRKCRLEYRDK